MFWSGAKEKICSVPVRGASASSAIFTMLRPAEVMLYPGSMVHSFNLEAAAATEASALFAAHI
jgi:hypothetical protein